MLRRVSGISRVMLFDAHNHIQSEAFAACLPSVLERADKAGVTRMMTCATGARGDWDRLLRLDDEHRDGVAMSVGLHPWHVASNPANWKNALQKILDERPFAIGEIGLDRSERCDTPIEDQVKAFAWQLDLATERNLPATIHCIGAWDLLSTALLGRTKLRYLLHAYHASPELTKAFARRGAHFSIGTSAFGPHARSIAPTLALIPKDRLLIETDSPDAPFPSDSNHATGNEPARLPDVCTRVSTLLGKTPEETAQETATNALHFFELQHQAADLNNPISRP